MQQLAPRCNALDRHKKGLSDLTELAGAGSADLGNETVLLESPNACRFAAENHELERPLNHFLWFLSRESQTVHSPHPGSFPTENVDQGPR